MNDFSNQDVTITLTGEQWFAFLADNCGKELSPKGARLAKQAVRLISEQLKVAAGIVS